MVDRRWMPFHEFQQWQKIYNDVSLTELFKAVYMDKTNYKRAYFRLRDIVAKETNTGYSSVEIHSLAKDHILPLLLDDEECWTEDVSEISTKYLNEKGWKMFIEQFKIFSIDNFNVSIYE